MQMRQTGWKWILLCLSGGLLVWCTAARSAPKMVIPVTKIEAGVVPRGEKKDFEFTIRNEGDAALEIEVKPG